MEDKTEKIINDRISGLEKRQDKFEIKLDDLDEKLNDFDEKHDSRYIEMIKITGELKGSSKATEENTKRTADALTELVDEVKQSNKRTDSRFDVVNSDISDIKSKISSKERDETIKLEEKKMSNATILSILGGGFLIIQTLIQFVAPLFFS